MIISHLITIIAWLIFGMASLSFATSLGSPQSLPPFLNVTLEYWQGYIHEPIYKTIAVKFEFLIDFIIASAVVLHSLIRQKSRLNRSHKDLAIALSQKSQAIESLGIPLNLSDTKAINRLIDRVKTEGIETDSENLPRSNWFFTAQSSLMIAIFFSGSIWLFIRQVIY